MTHGRGFDTYEFGRLNAISIDFGFGLPWVVRKVIRAVLMASLLSGYCCVAVDAAASAEPIGDPVPQVTASAGWFAVVDDASIVHGRPLRADSWSRNDADESLSVQFSLASPGCSGVHAEVHETADTVVVELHEGERPSAVGRMCTMIVVPATLTVGLQAPLGDRTVLSAF
jgi:hypothetical protein